MSSAVYPDLKHSKLSAGISNLAAKFTVFSRCQRPRQKDGFAQESPVIVWSRVSQERLIGLGILC
jgi:hypothetical protein